MTRARPHRLHARVVRHTALSRSHRLRLGCCGLSSAGYGNKPVAGSEVGVAVAEEEEGVVLRISVGRARPRTGRRWGRRARIS